MRIKTQVLLSAVSISFSLWLAFKAGVLQVDSLRGLVTPRNNNGLRTSDVDDSSSSVSTLPTSATKKSSNTATKQNDSTPPLLLLHVGPRKTGTTTIQWFSGSHSEKFEEDNFYFVGHNPDIPAMKLHLLYKKCAKCSPQEEADCLEEWDAFQRVLDSHYAENHNVVVSEELLSSFHDEEDAEEHLWKHLLPILSRWRVRVVITHRRFYDWVPSKYYQVFNPRESSQGTNKDEQRSNWPDAGGKPIPSFPDYFEKVSKSKSKYPTALKHKWDVRFPNNVEVFNMHNGGEFVESFFCTMLPEATRLCEYLTTEYSSTVKNSKSSKVLHYDMLAVAAYQKGLVPKSLSRFEVTGAVEAHAKELGLTSMTDFAMNCLTQKQKDKLLNVSLQFESEMLPEFFASPKGETELRSGFNKASEKGMFCSIDSDTVLKEPRWKKFFKSLTQSLNTST